MNKKIFIGIIGLMVITLLFASMPVKAEDVVIPDSSTLQFNLLTYLQHAWGIDFGIFSVAGTEMSCNLDNPTTYHQIYNNYTVIHMDTLCSSNFGFIDTFTLPEYKQYQEFKQTGGLGITCHNQGGCEIEVYCCAHKECQNVGQKGECTWIGSNSVCTTDYKSKNPDPYIDMQFPQWNYCSSNGGLICYYNDNPSVKDCKSAPPYYNLGSCPPKYNNYLLYEDKQTCINNICTPKTCSQLGYTCGSHTDNCGKSIDCGTCEHGDNGGGSGGETGNSLTSDAYDSATPEMLMAAFCKIPGDCSKTTIYDIAEGYESNNYSVTCKYSTTIVSNNKNAVLIYAGTQGIAGLTWSGLCSTPNFYSKIINLIPGIKSLACDTFSAQMQDTGTCVATQKAVGFDYCKYTTWANFKIFDKNNPCTDGLITIVIGGFAAILIFKKLF